MSIQTAAAQRDICGKPGPRGGQCGLVPDHGGRHFPVHVITAAGNRGGGGPAPRGNGSKPIHSCDGCGAMYSGGSHACRQAAHETEREAI